MTTHSMTAYAIQTHGNANGQWSWEIKSVNHRYLECQFKLPESLRYLEPKLRENLKNFLTRGKVDVTLQYSDTDDSADQININSQVLKKLFATANAIRTEAPPDIPITNLSISELLRWPGVVQSADPAGKADEALLLASFESTLLQLKSERAREGFALKTAITERLPAIEQIIKALKLAVPEIIEQQSLRFKQRINAFEPEVQAERLAQELMLFAQKVDIAEELDRLATHATEVGNILDSGGAIGRRLDFLMQELNREANTIGSKAVHIKNSQSAIDLKVLIEQMREQVQNIE